MNQPVGLTPKQADTLRFICRYIAAHGHAPSYKDILIGLGLSSTGKGTMCTRIQRLAARGYIDHWPHRSRTIRLTKAGEEYSKQFVRTA